MICNRGKVSTRYSNLKTPSTDFALANQARKTSKITSNNLIHTDQRVKSLKVRIKRLTQKHTTILSKTNLWRPEVLEEQMVPRERSPIFNYKIVQIRIIIVVKPLRMIKSNQI